jgi:hypothetical protein
VHFAVDVESALRADGHRLWCFGLNKGGTPKHPLYVKGETPLVEFKGLNDMKKLEFQLGKLKIDAPAYGSQGNAVLGIRDSGKTYTATEIAEKLFEAGFRLRRSIRPGSGASCACPAPAAAIRS